MKQINLSRLFALLGTIALLAAVRSLADGTSAMELSFPPVTPEEAPEKRESRIIDELYSRYVDCLQSTGRDERCYWRWRAECEKVIPWKCEDLELEMFGTSIEGEDFCSLRLKQRTQDAASAIQPTGTPITFRVPRN